MKALTEKLDLSSEQPSKIKPIMQELHDYTVKAMQNDSLSEQERLAMAAHRWCDLECKERSWQAGALWFVRSGFGRDEPSCIHVSF